MSKTESLMRGIGAGLAESIGIRTGQSARPTYAAQPGETPRTDFVRNRSVGDIHPREVMPDPLQPRKHFDQDEIEHLSSDIRQRGQLQPIRVRWSAEHSKWIIIAGERRWRAVSHAGLDKISCVFIDRDMSEAEIRAEQLVENLLREDLNGIEQARSFHALMELNGWNATELADAINVSKGKVSKALALLKLPEDLQAKIQSGALSPSTAYELAKAKSEDVQRQLAERAEAGEMTAPEAAKATRKAGRANAARRSTNESFRTADNVKVSIVSRKALGDAAMIQALIEVAETLRKRGKAAAGKAA